MQRTAIESRERLLLAPDEPRGDRAVAVLERLVGSAAARTIRIVEAGRAPESSVEERDEHI
ncbi:MAG: hypothetical protein EXR33_07035 [Betaproteobacteria bacterium]|nr:hypothetical protein [Betaproteobacteria bacterium]